MKRLAHLAFLLAAAACGGADAGTGPANGLAGAYTLTSYNGGALPAYLEPGLGPCSSKLVSGSLTGGEGGRIVFTRSYITPCVAGAPVAAVPNPGSITIAGSAVTITLDTNVLSPVPTVYTGTMSGDQITLQFAVPDRVSTNQLVQTFVLTRQ